MKLSREQIQFINDYLENSDIIHIDIRLEMVDHVASNIEERISNGDKRDFYFIFKDYMVKNKSLLLKNNKKFLRAAEIKILKAIGRTMLSFYGILVFAISFASIYLMSINVNSVVFVPYILSAPIIGFVIFAITYFSGMKFFKLDRYSSIERLGFVCGMFFQLFYFVSIFYKNILEQKTIVLALIAGFSMVLLFALAKVYTQMVAYYRNRFEFVE
ncbi:hypothetical protein [Winogradskyella tangerina]|uniref:hypothetical protein n=1 Tax=Winogradskyella tangerina TaxID=2023240 RepID=UPI000DBE307D|nr:hypothetical protein [Winogradskyella tangerina]